jgi:hypothetical protein
MRSQYENHPGRTISSPVVLDIQSEAEFKGRLDALRQVALRLRDALRLVIGYEPGLRPLEVGRRFGVNKDVSSRIVACCQFEDPFEFAYRCPSPATLRRVVRAAGERGTPTARPAGAAVDEFERFVRAEFGDQSTMNVLIGSLHPDLGAKAEAAQKQSAFRGMSQLHGLFAEVSITVAVISRAETPGRLDQSWADGCIGLRRLRPGPPIVIGAYQVDPTTGIREPASGVRVLPEDWGDVLGAEHAPGGSPWVRPRVVSSDGAVQTRIEDDVLGTRSAVSYGTIGFERGAMQTTANGRSPWCGLGQLVSVPAKLLLYDLLVEEGLFDDAAPRLVIYDTAMRGTSPLFDPSREFDRLHLHERVTELAPGPEGHRSSDALFLPDLVRFLLDQPWLTGRRFRGYRLRQAYPVYGSQVAFGFRRS